MDSKSRKVKGAWSLVDCGSHEITPCVMFSVDRTTPQMRLAKFSGNGLYFAWATNDGVSVVNAATRVPVHVLAVRNVLDFEFSPQGSYIATFERLVKSADESARPMKNVRLWNVASGEEVAGFTNKSQETWYVRHSARCESST